MRTIGALMLAAVVLVGCSGDSPPDKGIVTARDYDDPDEWDDYIPGYTIHGSCTGGYGNQPRVCSADVHIPSRWEHHSDGPHWSLRLRDGEGKDAAEGWREVDETSYHHCPIGQNYPACVDVPR